MTTQTTCSLELVSQKEYSWLKDFTLIFIGSILIALCSPLSIKLPFTPVPLSLANHVCLALAMVLGPKRGFLAVVTYLFQGMIGLPVFALGDSGLLHLLGPRGGYLWGFAAAAWVTGYLIEKAKGKSESKIFLALAAGAGIILLLGMLQLSLFIGVKSALFLGVFPFIPGDIVKTFLVYFGGKRFLNKFS
jgi:biotin transport system substrate-specific component